MRVIPLLALAACSSGTTTPAAPTKPKPTFEAVGELIALGEAPKTTSVLVMQRGEIVYEQYWEGTNAESLHDTRSVGKSVTSLAVGVAIAEKKLPGVDAKAFAYLADLAPFAHDGPLKQAITIEDFLTMSSALDCNDFDDKNAGNEENMYPLERWSRWAADLDVQADYQRDEHGRGPWHYCTAGTLLLGQIVQRVAKQSIDELIATRILAPFGITRWEFARSPSNEVMTGGGLQLRTRDWAAIMEMVRNRGMYRGKQIVPAAYVDAALSVHRTLPPDQEYGYLFWHRTYHAACGDFPAWYMGGNGGNAIISLPQLEAVIVVTRTFYGQGMKMHTQTTALVEKAILPSLCGS